MELSSYEEDCAKPATLTNFSILKTRANMSVCGASGPFSVQSIDSQPKRVFGIGTGYSQWI